MGLDYAGLIVACARSLGPDEWWVIDHDDGPLWNTASKQLDRPVMLLCLALDCSWDDARQSGFRLARLAQPRA